MVINIKLLLLTTYIYSYYIDIFKVPPSFQSWPTFDGSEVGKPLIITTELPAPPPLDPLTVKLLIWVVQTAWDIIFDPTIKESAWPSIQLVSPPKIPLWSPPFAIQFPLPPPINEFVGPSTSGKPILLLSPPPIILL